MAQGDLTVFEEAKAYMLDGGWAVDDDIKCKILDSDVTPVESHGSTEWATYSEVGASGTYITGGTSLGEWQVFISEVGGDVTADSAINPEWAQDDNNDADARWAVVYNDTDSGDRPICFVDLGAEIDMRAGKLTVTWHTSGLFTIT